MLLNLIKLIQIASGSLASVSQNKGYSHFTEEDPEATEQVK
jgi:hypothetical protein